MKSKEKTNEKSQKFLVSKCEMRGKMVQQSPAATTRILRALTLRSSSALQHALHQTITNKKKTFILRKLQETLHQSSTAPYINNNGNDQLLLSSLQQ